MYMSLILISIKCIRVYFRLMMRAIEVRKKPEIFELVTESDGCGKRVCEYLNNIVSRYGSCTSMIEIDRR